ncbi:MAG: hypothetical protein J7M13_07870, partial [Synergistetes bacterium]|nr:hypothetical protein [Synergistota bacterium]
KKSDEDFKRWKEEMDAWRKKSDEDFKRWKEEMEKERKKTDERIDTLRQEWYKQWGDLARKMGTLVEDIVAPALPEAIERRFNLKISDISVRRLKRKNGDSYETDIVAVAGDYVFVVEVRSYPRPSDIDEVDEKISRFLEFFPEYCDRKIIPVYSTLYANDNIINRATKKKIYVLALKGDYMDFINADRLSLI